MLRSLLCSIFLSFSVLLPPPTVHSTTAPLSSSRLGVFSKDRLALISKRRRNNQRLPRAGPNYIDSASDKAIYRGLKFIYRTARQTDNFLEYGHDYLWLFHTISVSTRNSGIQRVALRMGIERARLWRHYHRAVPAKPHPDTIIDLTLGSDAATSLGFPDEDMKEQIKRAASRYSARDYLGFDPVIESPPNDIPARCGHCHARNSRGARFCVACNSPLKMRSRYDVWRDALIITYAGDHFGITLGAHYDSVLKWLPLMRASYLSECKSRAGYYATVYAVTHIVYTLNDYGAHRLSPRWLPNEYEFLKMNLRKAISMKDVDILGEIIESLKSFGLDNVNPFVRPGVQHLISHQNLDGSWGNVQERDVYRRYHPTWSAISALNEYSCETEELSFPAVRPLLEKWAQMP